MNTPSDNSATSLDHVAVAVERGTDAWPRYGGELGGRWASGGMGVGFAPSQIRFANGMKVEVLSPHRVEENDFLRRFLDRNGPGAHHLTFKVPDLSAALERAASSGYRPVAVDRSDPDWQEAFLHPKDIPGIVVQLAQASGAEWSTPPPQGWPSPRTPEPATLEFVAHAVADAAEGERLFAGLLEGVVSDRGSDAGVTWMELAWPGQGRIRLLSPTGGTSWVTSWLGGRAGRLHHLAFACDDPGGIAGAVPRPGGTYEVPPDANLGVRLVLRRR